MEQQFFAVTEDMVEAFGSIGITVSDHTLYLTVTSDGAYRIIPIRCDTENEWTRTKKIGLLQAVDQWVRLYSDQTEGGYRTFHAPQGRFPAPVWLH